MKRIVAALATAALATGVAGAVVTTGAGHGRRSTDERLPPSQEHQGGYQE
jgi:hypothetical protein